MDLGLYIVKFSEDLLPGRLLLVARRRHRLRSSSPGADRNGVLRQITITQRRPLLIDPMLRQVTLQ